MPAWRRLIRSPRSSGTIERSPRCSATVFLRAASTLQRTRSATSPSASPIGTLYVHQRTLLERHAKANREGVWNGRPISLIVLAEPLDVLDGTPVSLIELIPPVHQRVYRMGLEHLGVVVGEELDDFSQVHRAALTGQQFQSAYVDPVYVLFEDFTHVKFYRRSLYDGVDPRGSALRRPQPRRRLGAAAAGHRHRPEPAAAVTRAGAVSSARRGPVHISEVEAVNRR